MSGANIKRLTGGPAGPLWLSGFITSRCSRPRTSAARDAGSSWSRTKPGDWYRCVTPGGHRPPIRIGERVP